MSISFGFGSGGASSGTFVGSYTGQHYVYGYAGAYPTGNPNINGTRIVSIDSVVLNGSWSATNGWRAEYHTDGNVLAIYNTSGGTGSLNFTRYFGNGGTVNSDTGDTWTGGGLQGTIYWSTCATAPSSISATRVGRDVTVHTAGAPNIQDGGSSISSYGVQYAPQGGTWAGNWDISSGAYTIRGLTPGVSYYFRTYANNAHGSGAAITSGLVTIPNLPTAPSLSQVKNATAVTLTIGNTTSTDAPTYYVQRSLDNKTWESAIQVTTTPRTHTYSGQTPGQTYFYRAYATSAVGQGAYSTVQSVAIATVPSAPASVSGVRSGRSVTVTVGASSSTGGDPITSYGIQYSNDGGSTWSAAVSADANLQHTFTNLTTGTTYVFRAYATNDIGNSPTTSSAGIFISGYGKRFVSTPITGATVNGSEVTFTAAAHGFSVTDLVDVTDVTPATLNQSQTAITAVTADTFTVTDTVTDAYTSGGTASGYAMVLNGSRYTAAGWVPITTSQKVASGTTYSSFN